MYAKFHMFNNHVFHLIKKNLHMQCLEYPNERKLKVLVKYHSSQQWRQPCDFLGEGLKECVNFFDKSEKKCFA